MKTALISGVTGQDGTYLSEFLLKKGQEQVKKFSWEKCAKETMEVYKKL
jgi:GDP-D-mannose dehydratase